MCGGVLGLTWPPAAVTTAGLLAAVFLLLFCEEKALHISNGHTPGDSGAVACAGSSDLSRRCGVLSRPLSVSVSHQDSDASPAQPSGRGICVSIVRTTASTAVLHVAGHLVDGCRLLRQCARHQGERPILKTTRPPSA